MNPVTREEIIDYVTYEEKRDKIRSQVLKIKEPRRTHLGEYLTFLFENRETVRYQIQEMMRIERIVKEDDIQHEIDTYNELLGGPDDLGCTLLIEIDDKAERDIKLKELLNLPERIYLVLESGRKIFARFDPSQIGEDRLSAVQYLTFRTNGETPVAIGADHKGLKAEAKLEPHQREALTMEK